MYIAKWQKPEAKNKRTRKPKKNFCQNWVRHVVWDQLPIELYHSITKFDPTRASLALDIHARYQKPQAVLRVIYLKIRKHINDRSIMPLHLLGTEHLTIIPSQRPSVSHSHRNTPSPSLGDAFSQLSNSATCEFARRLSYMIKHTEGIVNSSPALPPTPSAPTPCSSFSYSSGLRFRSMTSYSGSVRSFRFVPSVK